MRKLFQPEMFLVFLFCFNAYAEPTTIGGLSELTGQYARLGNDCLNGYKVASKSAPDTIRLIFGDNQSDPKVGISEFRRLVETENARIVLTTRSPVGLAINPLSKQKKIPLIGAIGHPRFTAENPYAVRVYPVAADEAEALVRAIPKIDQERVAIISVEDEYFLGLKKEFESRINAGGVIFSEVVAPTEQDFASYVAKINSLKPTAIFLNVGLGQLSFLVQKIKESGSKINLYSNFLMGVQDVRNKLGSRADDIVFVEPDYEKPLLLTELKKQTGSEDFSAIGYSCYLGMTYALTLDQVARKQGVSLIEAEQAVNKIETLDGEISFLNREAKISIVPRTIKNGATVSHNVQF